MREVVVLTLQPARSGFAAIGREPFEAATLRSSPRDSFFAVALPLA